MESAGVRTPVIAVKMNAALEQHRDLSPVFCPKRWACRIFCFVKLVNAN
jgi:hypothetical protein